MTATDDNPTQTITQQIHAVQNRLRAEGGGAEMTNAERVLWGHLALAAFASESGQSDDLTSDPETVLGDLLADLMHFCDARATDFESALARGRNHHREEIEDEAEAQADPAAAPSETAQPYVIEWVWEATGERFDTHALITYEQARNIESDLEERARENGDIGDIEVYPHPPFQPQSLADAVADIVEALGDMTCPTCFADLETAALDNPAQHDCPGRISTQKA